MHDIDLFEDYLMKVCYDLHKLGVDPNLVSRKNVERAFRDDLEVSTIVCLEQERISILEDAAQYDDWD